MVWWVACSTVDRQVVGSTGGLVGSMFNCGPTGCRVVGWSGG